MNDDFCPAIIYLKLSGRCFCFSSLHFSLAGMQELIEKVMILKKAVERERRLFVDSGSPILAEKLRYRIDGFQSRD